MGDITAAILFLLVAVIFVGGMAVIVYRLTIGTALGMIFLVLDRNPFRHLELFPKKLTDYEHEFIAHNFDYYKNLPPVWQKVFVKRLARFLRTKMFEGRQGLQVTEEMKLTVSASAIQLTLGLSDYRLSYFQKILLYPNAYYSQVTKNYHKGEVHHRGMIVFSWADFKEGYTHLNDNINLGLHEFAHALFVNFLKNRNECINFETYYDDWRDIGDKEFFKMRKQKKHYLRSYASVNLMEFFAVCVEHFFEAPNEFKKNLPDLYNILSRFLAQDPSKWSKA